MSDDPSDGGAPLFSSLPGAEERVMSTRKTGSVVAGWVAAVVIGVSVVLAMGRVVMDKSEMARAEAAEGGTRVSRMEAEMGARYLVGMNEIVGPVLVAGGESKERWLWTVAEAAQYARQRVSLVILRWEILGDEALAADFPVVFGDEDDRRDWETLAVIRRAAAEGGVGVGELSDDDRARFRERFGWVGRLALSRGWPEGEPSRRVVLGEARRTFLGSVMLACGVLGAFVLGSGLALWALVRRATGRWVWRFDEWDRGRVAARGGSVWLETFAVYLGVMVMGGWVADGLPSGWAPWPQAAAFAGAAVLGAIWPRWRGVTWAEWMVALGWRRGRGVMREIGAGLLGYCAGLPIIAVGVGLTMALTLVAKADATHPLNHLTGVSAPALAFLGFLAAVWAPVVEETFFRGAFYSAWRQSGGRWVAGVGTGVIFAAVHPQGWTAIPALGAVGLVMALLREWRGSVIASMTAHALNNGTLFAVMVVVMR